jgi:hypothetical protein
VQNTMSLMSKWHVGLICVLHWLLRYFLWNRSINNVIKSLMWIWFFLKKKKILNNSRSWANSPRFFVLLIPWARATIMFPNNCSIEPRTPYTASCSAKGIKTSRDHRQQEPTKASPYVSSYILLSLFHEKYYILIYGFHI